MRNITIASIGLRPPLLFFASSGVRTTAPMAARKLSHATSASIASSGSPFADSASSRLFASKNPNCPITHLQESSPHAGDSHRAAERAIFRDALKLSSLFDEADARSTEAAHWRALQIQTAPR